MNSLEIINKASSKNLTQEETAEVMKEIFLGKISEKKIEAFNYISNLLSFSLRDSNKKDINNLIINYKKKMYFKLYLAQHSHWQQSQQSHIP